MRSKAVLSRPLLLALWAVLAGFAGGPSSALADTLAACPARPDPGDFDPQVPSVTGEPLFDDMIAWIAMNTTYDLSRTYNDPPTISFCLVGEVIDYENSDLLVDPALLAAFDREQRHIFLTHPSSPLDYFHQSVLLHELIHDVQLQTRDWACAGAPEMEAYLLQNKWLFERGVRHRFNWTMIRTMSECPG